MNSRRPGIAGIDQLSLNLSATRSLGSSSDLFWPLAGAGGGVVTGGLIVLAACLEAGLGTA